MKYSNSDRREAQKIARKLFGMWDWNGILEEVHGTPQLINLVNSWLYRNRPKGSKWMAGVKEYGSFTGGSIYYIKKI